MEALQKYLILLLISVNPLMKSMGITQPVVQVEFTNPYQFNIEIKELLEKDTTPWKHQLSAAAFTHKGFYDRALKEWDKAIPARNVNYSEMEKDSILQLYSKYPAKHIIIEEAQKHKITIINEAHHNSMHRVFADSLLSDLYTLGYRHLFLEALGNGKYLDSMINKRGYPILSTGYYTKDPHFANLIRNAIQIGYTIHPYETTKGSNGKQREIDQAQNIFKVIQQSPGDKFLIHCGFDHVFEGKHNSWEKAMAARLSEYTGLELLSINQVPYSPKANPALDDPLLKVIKPQFPLVLKDREGKIKGYRREESYADIAVFHPRPSISKSGQLILKEGNTKRFSINLEELELQFPIMILIFNAPEGIENSIPVKLFELEEKQKSFNSQLKPGSYKLVLTDYKKKSSIMNIRID